MKTCKERDRENIREYRERKKKDERENKKNV